jgi:DNA-binding SARP family transcriptional activator
MRFRMLGPLEIRDGMTSVPLGGQRTRTLCTALLLRANRTAGASWLSQVLWPDERPASAEANLRQYIAKVRHLLRRPALAEIASLCSAPPGYRLEVPRDEVDLYVFCDQTARGRTALALGDLAAARDAFERAVSLWQGDLCEGLTANPELEIERTYWHELRLFASESLVSAQLGLGEHHEAVVELQKLTAGNPLREELRGMHMISLYRAQRRGDALEVFGRTRSVLRTELGIEPGPYLQRLQQAILADDPSLISGAARWLVRPA